LGLRGRFAAFKGRLKLRLRQGNTRGAAAGGSFAPGGNLLCYRHEGNWGIAGPAGVSD
jgi:hypothetical protein